MSKMVILVGPPCSGKSTWTKKFLKENKDYIRINRDSLRETLKMQLIVDKDVEFLISKITTSLIKIAESSKKNVVLDNTHCRSSYIKDIIKGFIGHEFTIKFFDEPLWKLKVRNVLRFIKTLGKVWIPMSVITRMHNEYQVLKKNIHIDLADYTHRIVKIER